MHGETVKAYNTSKWVLKCLKEQGFRVAKDANSEETQPKMKTLDVGAINNHFKGVKWMDLTPIDVCSSFKRDWHLCPPISQPFSDQPNGLRRYQMRFFRLRCPIALI
jgi:hypothetical protein